jgi:hypothetical protein
MAGERGVRPRSEEFLRARAKAMGKTRRAGVVADTLARVDEVRSRIRCSRDALFLKQRRPQARGLC